MKLFLLLFLSVNLFGARIKDIAMLKGLRPNQLVGYGLVIGLNGTGDKANDLTENSLSGMLKGIGIDTKSAKLDTKNSAIVVATATLPPMMKIGTPLDVTISSVGTAGSLEGGTLMMTSLKGADGKIYAMAQGKVLVMKKGDKGGGGGSGSLTALISNGAILEKEIPYEIGKDRTLRYYLSAPDFTTSVRVATRINDELGGKFAIPVDASIVEVIFPYTFEGNPSELIAQIEGVEVETDRRAKIVVNPRTGTVILGEQVHISPVAMAHGNLKIEVKEEARNVAAAGAAGAPAPQTAEGGKSKRVMLMNHGSNISEIVQHLNEMGASPDDLVALLQSLKSAGAIMADLEIL